jgi:lysophospholipase L1-like esterase
MTSPQPRQLLRDALAVTIATLGLLAGLELGARAFGLGAPERFTLPPKLPGEFRVLAVGESTVQGVPEGAYGFVSFLQHELHRLAPARAVRIHNLARSGEGSAFVRDVLAQTLTQGVDLAIVMVGHNEFLVAERTRGWRGALFALRERSRFASWLAHTLGRDGGVEAPLPERIEPVWPDGEEPPRVVEAFRENLAASVALATERSVPLVLCTAPSNLAEWPPADERVARDDAAAHAEAVRSARAKLAAGALAEAQAELAAERARGGDDAMLLFLEAHATLGLGRPDDARPLFERARDRDLVPRRASSALNDVIRAAAQGPSVELVDAAQLIAAAAPHGLVGFDLICDNCHPTPRGHALIAREIAAALARRSWLLAPGAELGSVDEWLARLDQRLGDADARQRIRARWLLSNALYAMKTPFFNFDASRRYLEEVRRIAPGDWRVWGNLATLALLDGDLERGKRQLLLATRLHGAPLDPAERGSLPYLAEALSRSRVELPRPGAGAP